MTISGPAVQDHCLSRTGSPRRSRFPTRSPRRWPSATSITAGSSRERPSSSCWRRRERWARRASSSSRSRRNSAGARPQISVALAVRLALFGLIAPFAAAFINRFGVRPVVVSAVAMIVAGILASMAMTEVWELVALWGVIVGIGTGMVALVLGATIATRWFVQRRGLVVGMLTASSATGQLDLPAAHRQADAGPTAGAARSPSSSPCCSSRGPSRS